MRIRMDIASKIKAIRKSRRETQSQFADALGGDVKQPMVSKWETGEDVPGTSNLMRLSQLSGENFFLMASGAEHLFEVGRRPVTSKVIGAVQAGKWRESIEFAPEDQFSVTFPLPWTWIELKTQGFVVIGESMNMLYPDGCIVVAAPTILNRIEPQHGDKVIVQRQDTFGMFEVTIKELVVDEAGRRWLWPRSTESDYKTPLLLAEPDPHSTEPETHIAGIIIASLRIEDEGRFEPNVCQIQQ